MDGKKAEREILSAFLLSWHFDPINYSATTNTLGRFLTPT